MSCGPRRTANMTKAGKWMEKKKRTNPAKKRGLKKNEKLFSQWCSGGSTHDPNQEGSESRPLNHEPQVPPKRPYLTNLRTPLPFLYRNIDISSVGINNNKNVLLIVLLYCYSSTLPGYAHGLKISEGRSRLMLEQVPVKQCRCNRVE